MPATLVVVHPAEAGKGLTAWIQNIAEPVQANGPAELNEKIIDRIGHPRPQILGIPSCTAEGCGLAATATFIWASTGAFPGMWAAERACEAHRPGQEARTGVLILPPLTLPARAYSVASGPDMAAMATALAPHRSRAEGWVQPSCRRCRARLAPPPAPGLPGGSVQLTWRTAAGAVNCSGKATRHDPAPSPAAASIAEHWRYMWGETAPAPMPAAA